jgi:hypothetical protein
LALLGPFLPFFALFGPFNDELNGVDNEADNWQVNNFQILIKIFGRFAYFFGSFL